MCAMALALGVSLCFHNLQLKDLAAQTASDMAALLASREWELCFQISAAVHKLAWAEGGWEVLQENTVYYLTSEPWPNGIGLT